MNQSPPILFDRPQLRKQLLRRQANFAQHDFLAREMAASLAESLAHVTYSFPTMVEIGATGLLAEQIAKRPGTQHYVAGAWIPTLGTDLLLEEEVLPFAPESLDAIVSAGGLHWVNDLPGSLRQMYDALKPDGLFMAVMPGPDTLKELRQVFAATDAALSGGITPRIAPFPDVRDAGGLLQRAGFALPVVDRDFCHVSYGDLFGLMADLRGSGQANMLQQKLQHFTPRGFFVEAAKRYADMFADGEGRIPATFEFITLTAWQPAANQQQPARRGSGQMSLKDVLS
jgi:SAM-dependent methyltransferase